jgi:ATP-dependent Lhr-like helicase
MDKIEIASKTLQDRDSVNMCPEVEEEAIEGLKFSACLPREMAVHLLGKRLQDPYAVRRTLRERVRFVS